MLNRQNVGWKYFTLKELTFLFYHLTRVGSKMVIGDVHPCNILINGEGYIKILVK